MTNLYSSMLTKYHTLMCCYLWYIDLRCLSFGLFLYICLMPNGVSVLRSKVFSILRPSYRCAGDAYTDKTAFKDWDDLQGLYLLIGKTKFQMISQSFWAVDLAVMLHRFHIWHANRQRCCRYACHFVGGWQTSYPDLETYRINVIMW